MQTKKMLRYFIFLQLKENFDVNHFEEGLRDKVNVTGPKNFSFWYVFKDLLLSIYHT